MFRWCHGPGVYLLEISLNCNLAQFALHLKFQDGSSVLPDVIVQEVEDSSVAVLFATSSSVFRLLLPHPATINKVGSLFPDFPALCGFFLHLIFDPTSEIQRESRVYFHT